MDGGFLASLATGAKNEDGEPGGLKMPKELKRKNIVMLDKLGSGAFGDVNKGLYNPEVQGVPEFAVAIKVRDRCFDILLDKMKSCLRTVLTNDLSIRF